MLKWRRMRSRVAFFSEYLASRRDRKTAQLIAPLFDKDFYLASNPDVAECGIDPLLHYVQHGWREGRDPSASFSTQGYLANHGKLAAEGENPLVHFLRSSNGQGLQTDSKLESEDNSCNR